MPLAICRPVPTWSNTGNKLELLVDHGGDPSLPNAHDGRSATAIAAHRGRRAALVLFQQRGAPPLTWVDALIGACALNDREAMRSLTTVEPDLASQLVRQDAVDALLRDVL